MYDLDNTGATLRGVGERFGLTGERVRQIFRSAGLSTRSITETQSLRHDHLVEEQGDQIAAAFRRHKDVGEVAERLQVPHTLAEPPTITAYDELARNSNGRLPSALTVKNRLGSWYSALARAGL